MDRTEQNLEIALTQIKQMHLENKELKEEIEFLKSEVKRLITPNSNYHTSEYLSTSHRINSILSEADQAMKRYTEKLKMEGLKNAKQKQSKRQ